MEHMLTTIDNPFDYFTQFDEWLIFDKQKGYNSCEKLARIAQIKDEMTSIEEDAEIERAIDEIIKHDILNVFKKASRERS
jgi:hypothetical protein